MLICYLEKNFKIADEIALQIKPELKESVERCIWVCRDLIHKHESEGHTKMNASSLAKALHSSYPELIQFVLEAVENPLFHYEKENKIVALKSTWDNECKIAEVIKEKVNNPFNSEMNWENYSEVDGMKLTEEQLSLLKEINEKSIVMLNGILDEEEMRKNRFNLSDLTEALRLQGYLDISVVDTVILETNGQMTIIPKNKYKIPDCNDLNIDTKQDTLPYILISDGKLNDVNMKKAGFDELWLNKQLKSHNASSVKDVFVMTYYDQKCHIQLKGGKSKK